jgi:pseudaminic acid synthase
MKIGNFDLNRDGTYIIAELSANHNGSLQNALKSIQAAKDAGANAIKLQTYTAETITLNARTKDFLITQDTLWDGKYLYDLYQEAYTPWEWHEELFAFAREIGIDIFSSPFDKTAVDFLEKFNPSAYKIASFEITDYELIRYTASKMKPIIISTGIALEEEIKDAVEICRSVGNNDIILLKCTSQYPAPLHEANLVTIQDLAKRYSVVSGFSDHTLGSTAPIVAVTLGAKVIEKHFIIDKSIGGADAEFSMNAREFKEMVQSIRDAEQLLGVVDYSMSEKKQKSREHSRSIYVSKDIKKGEKFSTKNLRSVRPGYGMHPKHLEKVLGTTALKDYKFAERFELPENIDS